MTIDIELRPATASDAHQIYEWRNDPFIVARSSTRTTVSRQEHDRWFSASLRSSDRMLFVIMIEASPSGLVRFDRTSTRDAVISVYLPESRTGRGHGVAAIKAGVVEIARRWNVDNIVACVREDNRAGQKAFRKAGFQHGNRAPACPADHIGFRLTLSNQEGGRRFG